MLRILNVDDEPDILKLLSLILERAGYDQLGVTDAAEAWVLLHADRFDLFVQDLMRPDMDGWRFCRAIRGDVSLRRLPVVILTARAQDVDKDYAAHLPQVEAYITKPFGPQELLERLEVVLARHGHALPNRARRRAASSRWKTWSSAAECGAALRNSQPSERRHALTVLRANEKLWPQIDDFIVPLREALEDADDDVRVAAMKTVGVLAEVRLVEPLLRALDDSDYDEHRWALWALGQLNDRPAVEAVAARLHHSDWRERCLAALALQNQPTEVAIGGLIESWRDKVAFVRLAVVIALGHSAEAAALEILRAALNDTDWWVRFAAIEALARLKDSDSVEALAHQLFEADTDLASQTIFALQRIGDRRAIPHLQRIAADDTRTDERGWAVSEHARHAIGVLEGSMK